MGIDETPNDNERRRIEVEMFIRVHSMTQKLFRNEFFLNIYTFFNNLLVDILSRDYQHASSYMFVLSA